MLDTSASLVPSLGSLAEEKALVKRWLNGPRGAHPALRRIGLMYGRQGAHGHLSDWAKSPDGSGWYREEHYGPIIPPNVSLQLFEW